MHRNERTNERLYVFGRVNVKERWICISWELCLLLHNYISALTSRGNGCSQIRHALLRNPGTET
jgi:hypothetical protein